MTPRVLLRPGLVVGLTLIVVSRAWAQDARAELVTYRVTPSAVDSSIRRFDEPHYVVFEKGAKADAPLLVVMPGTGGRPQNLTEFANTAAHQG